MQDESPDAERQMRQHERWERAITMSILAVIASGILGIAAQDAFFSMNSDVPTDFEIFGAASYIREKPICPRGGKYTLGSVGEKPRCSIPGHTL